MDLDTLRRSNPVAMKEIGQVGIYLKGHAIVAGTEMVRADSTRLIVPIVMGIWVGDFVEQVVVLTEPFVQIASIVQKIFFKSEIAWYRRQIVTTTGTKLNVSLDNPNQPVEGFGRWDFDTSIGRVRADLDTYRRFGMWQNGQPPKSWDPIDNDDYIW